MNNIIKNIKLGIVCKLESPSTTALTAIYGYKLFKKLATTNKLNYAYLSFPNLISSSNYNYIIFLCRYFN